MIYFKTFGGQESLADRRAAQGVALSRKGAKSDTRGRKLRSTETKAGTRVPQGRGSITRLQQQLEARTRQLTEAQRHADDARSQLAEARTRLWLLVSNSPDIGLCLQSQCSRTMS